MGRQRHHRILRAWPAELAIGSVILAACASTTHPALRRASPVPPPAARTSLLPTTVTTAVPTTINSRLPGLQSGDSGPAVFALEQRLGALHYDVGTPDGHFGPADTNAVIAFQKRTGLARTGRATDDVLAALATATDPAPLVPGGGPMRVEIDLPRQVLFLYEHDQLMRILPVSTGSGQRYCVDGQCDVAVTPGGSYRIGEKILGLQISRLGQLFNPLYFNGGIAIHGEPDVPVYPASHGCVRIPMNSSLWFFNEVPSGTPVYVVGGPNAPVPFHEPAPSLPAPSPVTTPPTTAPPVSTAPTTTTTMRPTTTVPASTTSTLGH